jgi:soluble lytic murein transglycosylase-like protein
MPGITIDKLFEPAISIELGAAYWASLTEKLKSPEMALAAYNAGEGAVERFHGIPPYPETRSYVAQIVRLLGR